MQIKERIKKWLFSDEIDRIHKLENDYSDLDSSFKRAVDLLDKAYGNYTKAEILAENTSKIADDCRKMMNEICDVGVDIGFRDNYHSWAVVCIHGKMDFMKFVPLNHSDVRDVGRFLKQFEYSKRVVDNPFAHGMIDDLIAKF
ncbi:hypothetical protein [Lacrimispora indolis]|uniref:hypothetical protein n=1 Tax=Lacrimispora indolis TaxID=69825 RepID=UPI001FA6E602|nr:hypothetical protein [[Clostridium] methoxybenzovorans]